MSKHNVSKAYIQVQIFDSIESILKPLDVSYKLVIVKNKISLGRKKNWQMTLI